MKNRWLAASNFERMYEVVSAINTISVNAKLLLSGIQGSVEENELIRARDSLVGFLDQFFALLQTTEDNVDGTVIGDDPRLGKLLESYQVEKKRLHGSLGLYSITPVELKRLVKSSNPNDLPYLIQCLRELRSLVEQHSQADINNILGDI